MNEKNDSNSLELEKSKRRQSEIKKHKKIFKNIDENKKKIAEKLIDSAAFLTVELENLEKEISVEGVVEKYQNGENQSGVKKSSKVDVYNNFIKNYTAKRLSRLRSGGRRRNSCSLPGNCFLPGNKHSYQSNYEYDRG